MRKLLGLLSLISVSTIAMADPPPDTKDTTPIVRDAAATRADVQKTFGFIPAYIAAVPDTALPGLWEETKTFMMGTETALTNKQKDLIALGVASQIPCEYCIYAHTSFAKLGGATPTEIAEAVAMSGLTRHWSTFLNGMLPDEAKFRADVTKAVDAMKQQTAGKAPAPKTIPITDTTAARDDILQVFGPLAPLFLKFPAEGLVGAWRQEKELDLATTTLDPKIKALVGIAVAAQIPCRYCVIADTEFARAAGASEREIGEAIAVAAIVRDWSTLSNGLQVDKARFKKDIDDIVKHLRKITAKR